MALSKTTFQYFLCCPKNAWLKLHKPELLAHFTMSEFDKHLMEQGNEVESCARNLFPNGVEVVSRGEDACNETVRLMASKITNIFQATFIVDGFIARNDVLSFDAKNNWWDLYEIKATSSLKENTPERDHIVDVAFQVSVLQRANIPLGRFHLVHMNKEYTRHGALDIKTLFTIEDVTVKVSERLAEVENNMTVAQEYLNSEEPKGSCNCLYKGRIRHCTTFQYSNPHVPKYSVHDISRIHKTKLERLVEQGIFNINDVPEDFELSEKQKKQVGVHQSQRMEIDIASIKQELNKLKFPLYFLDYEAVGPAIPAFNGYAPYKRIPFQFSLHILKTPTSELEHIEYLHPDLTDPSQNVAKLLQKHIFPSGTVIAWHKSYEAGVNKEIAERLPEYTQFFTEVNNSLYDLKDIFHDQLYIHDGFHGSASLKKVLPIIAPQLSYKTLEIQEGGQAVDAWWKMVSPETPKKESSKIANELKIYCGQDTYAMYVIWKHLIDL
jgi:hypothetical protein